MLRNLALLALLVGSSTSSDVSLLRGGTVGEVAPYNFAEAALDLSDDWCYYLKVCCDGGCEESRTDYESGAEVREANVCRTQCLDRGGRKCNWSWRGEYCGNGGGGGGRSSRIECLAPHPSNIRKKGHDEICDEQDEKDVPYVCEDGTKMCCTDSSMTEVNFKDPDWAKMGTCRKKSDEVDAILEDA